MKQLVCLIVFLIAAQAGSADIIFQPQLSTIALGAPLTVDVMFSGGGSAWLGGYDIDVDYDPAVLQLSAVAWPDDFLGTSLRDAVFSTGSVNVAEISLSSGADLAAAQSGHDPFRLFELLFVGGLAPGVSPLTLARVELTDESGNLLAAGNTPAGRVTVLGGPAVPEPGTALILLISVTTSIAFLRKRRRA